MQGQDVCGLKISVERHWGLDQLESSKQDTACGFNEIECKRSLHRAQRLGGCGQNATSLNFVPGANPQCQPVEVNSNTFQTPNLATDNQSRLAHQHTEEPFQLLELKTASEGRRPHPFANKVTSMLKDFPHWLPLDQ